MNYPLLYSLPFTSSNIYLASLLLPNKAIKTTLNDTQTIMNIIAKETYVTLGIICCLMIRHSAITKKVEHVYFKLSIKYETGDLLKQTL